MKRKDLSSLKQQEKVKLNYEGVHSFISATVRYATLSPECIEAVLIRVQENAEPPAEHQIFSFGKMIMRDRCSTSYDLASLFRGRRNTLDRWSGKTAKCIGTRPSALHSTFLRSHQKKHRVLRLVDLFAPGSSFFSRFFFSDSSRLCFSMCPYCRKFDF